MVEGRGSLNKHLIFPFPFPFRFNSRIFVRPFDAYVPPICD